MTRTRAVARAHWATTRPIVDTLVARTAFTAGRSRAALTTLEARPPRRDAFPGGRWQRSRVRDSSRTRARARTRSMRGRRARLRGDVGSRSAKGFLAPVQRSFGTICRSFAVPAPMSKSPHHCREAFRRRRHRARARAASTRHDDYFESDRYVLSLGGGPSARDRRPRSTTSSAASGASRTCRRFRRTSTLKPIEKTETRLNALLKLIKRKDVSELINACDAGREGELIFRYIVQYAKASKPIAAAVAAVDDAGGDPRRLRARCAATQQMLPLADAARCRSEADWLVGINGTRAMTAFNSQRRRLPPHHRRPRADADAGDPGRARGEDPRVRRRATTGKCVGTFARDAGEYDGQAGSTRS